jgi:hypothetical protein
MPTLDRDERQRLRAIQEHLLNQALSTGAEYHSINTVGTIYHPNLEHPSLNLVIPHRGVAWTRNEDVEDGFQYLQTHARQPQFQFLEKLFPEAYAQYLQSRGLVLVDAQQIWLYQPIMGPTLPDETPYGQLQSNHLLKGMQVQPVTTEPQLKQWRELTHADEFLSPLKIYRWLGLYQKTPVAATQLHIHETIGVIMNPTVQETWQGFGMEGALFKCAVEQALSDACQMVYTINNATDMEFLERIGFVRFTRILTYKAKSHDNSLATPLSSNHIA